MRRAALLAIPLVVLSCAPEEVPVDTDVLSHLPRHEEQREALCARGRTDAVTNVFCRDDAPAFTSLVELQRLLGVSFDDPDDLPGFSLLAHSSSLATRSVSAINPRAIIVDLPVGASDLNGATRGRRADGNTLSMGYVRGDQLVELAVQAPGQEISFYLLRYEQACNVDGDADACALKDLLTPETERGWTRWSLYDDEDLKNSAFDCLHCHEVDGPEGRRIFRMQELENPWTHWVAAFTLGGRVLLDDYARSHGLAEPYAGIPGGMIPRSDPIVVEDLIRFSNSPQPNAFPSPSVEREVQESAPGQPADNSTPGTSPSWDVVYDCAVRGDAIPPPHHDVKVTDPSKLAAAADAYALTRDTGADLPDIREVFSDAALIGMSHRVKPGLDGRGILVHACAQCHNGRLDQDLTRARFDALRLDDLSRAAKDEAIDRLRRPAHDRSRMPPRAFRDLTDDEIEAAVAALQR